MLSAALSMIALRTITQESRYADLDRDGLVDRWETEGFGPIDPAVHGCKPGRADVFIVFAGKDKVTPEKLAPTIARMKKFYAEMPYQNPDGSTGLNMIAILPPTLPPEDNDKSYIELYEKAMPKEWRGLAHGICVGDSPGGGGQANRPDWCGTGYNWMTMVHEVGHQFGLPHDPLGARTGSPFHPSLMNYDYSYQLGGNGEAIMFSPGRFVNMRMKENDLMETVPYSANELAFLKNRPYYFNIKENGPNSCMIDWNRNGIFGESHIQADVNDGYGCHLRESIRLSESAGSPALASLGEELAVLYSDLKDQEAYKDYKASSLNRATIGNLCGLILKGREPGKSVVLAEDVAGDPVSFGKDGTVIVAYPTPTGFTVLNLERENDILTVSRRRETIAREGAVSICDSPIGTIVAHTEKATRIVTLYNADEGKKMNTVEIVSQSPVAAVWNSVRNQIAIIRTVDQDNKLGRIQILHLDLGKVVDTQWVEGEAGNAATASRPQVIFDGSRNRGRNGGFNIYVKGRYDSPDQPGINFICRQNEDVARSGGWRVKMMGNEWAFSRSVCAVTQHAGDIAYAYRWSGGSNDHTLLITRRASGVEDEWLTDFDEVSFIFEQGLRNSLRQVQNEQWHRQRTP
ncbi:MAG: hypothetical protein KF812_08430 [Fimbriimonadaceae bacterium]|nr:hypothetical protein [Fimbriimonadaceae bacterium]